MGEALKCGECGLDSEFAEAYIQQRRSFRSSKRAWCPACWSRKQARAGTRWYIIVLAMGLVGAALSALQPEGWMGPFLYGFCLFHLCLIMTIVPHELGHAWVARLLGWRVFRIVVGVGKTLGKRQWGAFEIEWKPLPLGGITLVGPVTTVWFRTKLFLVVAAGLLVNVALGASMLVFYPWTTDVSFDLDNLPVPARIFLLANAYVVVTNLWPRTWTNLSVKTPSDGKQLLQSFFLKRQTVADRHADYHTMEAMECLTQRDYAAAERWTEAGLALYPGHFNLLNTRAIAAIQQNKLQVARDLFTRLLQCKETAGLRRYIMLNNIAYVNALLGTEELLLEAEQYSAEAFRGIPWLAFMKGTRGTVLVMRGELKEGISLLEQSLHEAEEVTSKAENACILVIAESKRGDIERARHFLELARQLNAECYLLPRAGEAFAALKCP